MDFEMISMFVAGIALFLFGMMFFEETIRQTMGDSIKQSIQKYAGWLLRTISLGAVSTAILQSSHVTSMIMLWFVGAGILTLMQGIGIVIGANIGTTMTPWLIALLGFKMNISVIVYPVLALGGILLVWWSRYPKIMTIAKFLFGFGLLFLGLGYMKESVDVLSATFSLGEGALNLFQSILLWIIMTIVLQGSTGVSVITLTALSTGMISFDIALGMMIGANAGSAVSTFVLSFLSTTGKQKIKRLVAITHVLFNVMTAIVVILLLQPIQYIMNRVWLANEPEIALAAFHTIFNVIGVGLFAFIIPYYARFLHTRKWDDTEDVTLFAIEQVVTDMPEEYIVAMKADIREFGSDISQLIRAMAAHTNPSELMNDTYNRIKDECEEWMTKVLQYDIRLADGKQQAQIERYQLVVVDFLSAIKQLKDISLHYYYLRETKSESIHKYMDQFDEKLVHLTEIIDYVLGHGAKRSQEKIAQGEQVLLLDDTRFLQDIKSSIAKNNDDKENNHYRSQLLKTNRSVVITSRAMLDALLAWSRV